MTSGYVAISSIDGEIVKPYELYLNCWMVGRLSGEKIFNVALHELLHTLGLGHAKSRIMADGNLEIMAEYKPVRYEPQTYVSTLDLYALYRIYFTDVKFPKETGYRTFISLDDWREWRQVTPYVVEFQKLMKELNALHEKYEGLEAEITGLRDDIKTIHMTVDAVKTQMTSLQTEVKRLQTDFGNLRQELGETGEKLERLSGRVSEQEEEVAELRRQLSSQTEEITQLGKQVNTISGNLQDLSLQLQELRTRLKEYERQTLFLTLIALATAILALGLAIHAKRKGALK